MYDQTIFLGELIDKYKDINANSKTAFTDYAMLKLVLYSPHMFLFPVIWYMFILVQSFTLFVGKIALMANVWYVKIECRL